MLLHLCVKLDQRDAVFMMCISVYVHVCELCVSVCMCVCVCVCILQWVGVCRKDIHLEQSGRESKVV